jgi:ATP synthase protein I
VADRPPEQSLRELDSRLQHLREESGRASQAKKAPTAGYGLAFQLAADLVTGLVGGAAIGWALDAWLGTRPWGLIGFFFLGAAAGMWNVYKTVRVYERAAREDGKQ